MEKSAENSEAIGPSMPLGGIMSITDEVVLTVESSSEVVVEEDKEFSIAATKNVSEDGADESLIERSNADDHHGATNVTAVAVDPIEYSVQASYVHEVRAVEVPIEAIRVESVKKDGKCNCATSRLFPHRKSKCALRNTSTKTALGIAAATSVAVAGCALAGAAISKTTSSEKEVKTFNEKDNIDEAITVENSKGSSSNSLSRP